MSVIMGEPHSGNMGGVSPIGLELTLLAHRGILKQLDQLEVVTSSQD